MDLCARRIAPGLAGSLVFGLILGAACLAKAAMLPLGLLFLAASLFAVGSVRKAAVHLAVASAVWAVVFGVFVGAMMPKSGRAHARRRFAVKLHLGGQRRPQPRLGGRRSAPGDRRPPAAAAALRAAGLRV